MTQVHKETLGQIDNALPNRSNLDVEIFGMEGIPDDVVQSHNTRVLTQFAQAEAERRAASGNPAPGSAAANAAKKPKFESPSDIKKRLAEHKAKKVAEESIGGGSGGLTPLDAAGNQSPGFGQAPGFVILSPMPKRRSKSSYSLGNSGSVPSAAIWRPAQPYDLWPISAVIRSATCSTFPATTTGIWQLSRPSVQPTQQLQSATTTVSLR